MRERGREAERWERDREWGKGGMKGKRKQGDDEEGKGTELMCS